MSLQLILGSSGSGKSYQLYQEMIQKSLVNQSTNYIVIVPEQFTMETQKDLVSMHPNKGIMNIDILSFLRLAYRVFDEVGGNEKLVLEDTGKSMILRKVVELKKEQLILFGSSLKKQGFINELKSLLSEFYQYSVTPSDLENMIELTSKKPMFQSKLKDFLVVYNGFKEYLSEKYITQEEILDVLLEVIDQSDIIKNSVICFDGFTGFTPSQYKLLAKLIKQAKKVLITVTIDKRENISSVDEEFKLFHLSKNTITRLLNMAKEENVSIDKPIYPQDLSRTKEKVPYRFIKSSALASLEHNIFRYPYKQFEDEQEDITMHHTNNPSKEVSFITREVQYLISEKGYRYKDIAVVTGDIETYARLIEREFSRVNIPCFIDNNKDVLSNPLVELILSLIDMISKDFSYESVFRYLRCGFIDIEIEKIDRLENYVIALGIRGFTMWNKEWTRVYRCKAEIDLEQINEIRNQVVEPLVFIKESLTNKKNTVEMFTRDIYNFMIKLNAQRKLEELGEGFNKKGLLQLSKEYAQVYKIVMELFDKIVDLIGEEVMPLKEYGDILKAGLEEAKVGIIPLRIDQIVVGDIQRTRLKDIKALFFIGVNDGIVPAIGGSGGLISDLEREILVENKVELAPTKRQSAYIEQFYLYLNLTKPQNKLYVTYSKVGSDGKTLRPSFLIGVLIKLFPKIKVIDEDITEFKLENVLYGRYLKNYLVEGLRQYKDIQMTMEWKELFSWYMMEEKTKNQILPLIHAAFYKNEEKGLSKAVSSVLYGNELSNSVTRLEKYASCAFAHFISYGLELMERQEYKLEVPDLGNIFHDAIDRFSTKLKTNSLNWHTITDEERDLLVTESVNEAATDYGNYILKSSKRNEYMINRVLRITKRTIWALCEHIKLGEFEPSAYELKFSYLDHIDAIHIPLSKDEKMTLQGRIDRVDVCKEDDEVYVKVIDYKSGNTTFDIVSLYHGLQLQLVVYLSAALELEQKKNEKKKVIPAGIFYYNMDDPMIDKTGIDTENLNVQEKIEIINKNILKELKMNGIVNHDKEIIKRLDKKFVGEEGNIKGSVKSDVIPVETNKEGYPTKRSSVASGEQFKAMNKFVREKIKVLGSEILEGNTTINPYKLGDKTACDYCEYSGICGFDLKLPGSKFRNLKKIDKSKVWEEMMKLSEDEVNNGEG